MARQGKLLRTGHHCHVDIQDISSDTRPGEAGHRAHAGLLRMPTVAKTRDSEVGLHLLGAHGNPLALLFPLLPALHHLLRNFPADGGNFPFQVPHPCFAGVFGDHLVDRSVGDGHIPFLQSVLRELLRDDMAAGDFALVVLEVSGKLDDLHPVLQRRRNGVPHVRRSDEHDVRQVIVHVEIVIVERVVLLRVEHFQKGRRRIAPEIHAHLVHFVEQHQGIDDPGPLHGLDNLPRHRADVGAAVPTDLGLVAHASQRDAHEDSAERPRDRFGERCLADAGRTHEAENLSLHFRDQIEDRDMFEDPLLGFFESEMVLVQDLPDMIDLQEVLRPLVPGDAEHPFEIAAQDCRLGRHRGNLLQLLELLQRFLLCQLGHLRLPQVVAELEHIRTRLVLTQLVLQNADLLLDEELPLGLGDVVVDLGVDLLFDFQDIDLRIQDPDDLVELLTDAGQLENLLLHLDALENVRGDVKELPAGVAGVFERHQDLAGHVAVEVHVLSEEARRVPHQRVELRIQNDGIVLDRDGGFEEPGGRQELVHGGLHHAVDKDFHKSIGKLQDLDDLRNGPVGVDVIAPRLFGEGVFLRSEKDVLLALERLVDGAERRLTSHEDRKDHRREDYHIAQGQDRKLGGDCLGPVAASGERRGRFFVHGHCLWGEKRHKKVPFAGHLCVTSCRI